MVQERYSAFGNWGVCVNNFPDVQLGSSSRPYFVVPRTCFVCKVYPGFLYPNAFTCKANVFCGPCMRGLVAAIEDVLGERR